MQALEAAQWIKLTSSGADLTIYAGDFNTESSDVPYGILRTVGQLRDCWTEVHQEGEGGGETCDTVYNSYSSRDSRGKRIDYIMYRPGPGRTNVSTNSCILPLDTRIPASYCCNVSYSDHEALTSLIEVNEKDDERDRDKRKNESLYASRDVILTNSIDVINKAISGTAGDQKIFSIITVIVALLFMSSFTQFLYVR